MTTRNPKSAATTAISRAGAAAAVTALAFALPGCSADQTAAQPPTTTAVASVGDPTSAAPPAAADPRQPAATLQWPKGTTELVLTNCVSIGATTIQGRGETPDWQVYFDANLLTPEDSGTLQVSRASDKAIEYDADIATLAVQPDGTFQAAGRDAAGEAFQLSGVCQDPVG